MEDASNVGEFCKAESVWPSDISDQERHVKSLAQHERQFLRQSKNPQKIVARNKINSCYNS
jgi:hypothetical protein